MKRIVVIVGAGWSKAAGWPDTSEILDHPAWLVARSASLRYRAVWDGFDHWRGGDSNRTGDAFMSEVLNGRIPGLIWPMVVEVISGTIASAGATMSPVISPRYADSLMRPNNHPSHRAFIEEVLAAGEVTAVISMNYDILIEKVLRPEPMRRPPRPGFFYGGLAKPQVCASRSSSPFGRDRAREPLELTGTVPIWKLHGSMNWQLDAKGEVLVYPDLRAAFRAGGQAAIIPPLAPHASLPPYLKEVWRGAAAVLRDAEEWWVAGYSLPPADRQIADMLSAAALSGDLQRILVRNRTDRTRQRWEAVAGLARVEFGPSL